MNVPNPFLVQIPQTHVEYMLADREHKRSPRWWSTSTMSNISLEVLRVETSNQTIGADQGLERGWTAFQADLLQQRH
jgi:hypothetical protein